MNKVILMGRLTGDPEMRKTQSGKAERAQDRPEKSEKSLKRERR